MFVSIALTISIIIFCFAIVREESRRKKKLYSYLRAKDDSDLMSESKTHGGIADNDRADDEYQTLRKKLKEKDDIIGKLQSEYSDTNLKMETYLSLTKASQELILRNDERVRTVSKLWEEKTQQLEKESTILKEQIQQYKRQHEKYEDDLNSRQHQINNLNRLLAEKDDRIEELESDLEQLQEVEDKLKKKVLRVQQLESDLEHLEEIGRKDNDKMRAIIKEKDLKIEQFEAHCKELKPQISNFI